MPGHVRAAPEGMKCDDCDMPAVNRVQGETDSFGCEYGDYCTFHYEDAMAGFRLAREEARVGCCDWCKGSANDLRQTRDYEEGMGGPLYMVCGACITRRNEEATAELEANGHFDGDDYDTDSWFDADPAPDPTDWDEVERLEAEAAQAMLPPDEKDKDLPEVTPMNTVAYVDGRYITHNRR
jgi:hypothetical protein